MHSYTVSLRIESATLDTGHVTEQLGLTPTQTRFVGQYRSEKSVWEKALWEYDVEPEQSDVAAENWPDWPQWESLERALEKATQIFASHANVIQSYREHHNVYLWVGHFSSSFDGGPRLSPEILKTLGNFGVAVWVGTYFTEREAP